MFSRSILRAAKKVNFSQARSVSTSTPINNGTAFVHSYPSFGVFWQPMLVPFIASLVFGFVQKDHAAVAYETEAAKIEAEVKAGKRNADLTLKH